MKRRREREDREREKGGEGRKERMKEEKAGERQGGWGEGKNEGGENELTVFSFELYLSEEDSKEVWFFSTDKIVTFGRDY